MPRTLCSNEAVLSNTLFRSRSGNLKGPCSQTGSANPAITRALAYLMSSFHGQALKPSYANSMVCADAANIRNPVVDGAWLSAHALLHPNLVSQRMGQRVQRSIQTALHFAMRFLRHERSRTLRSTYSASARKRNAATLRQSPGGGCHYLGLILNLTRLATICFSLGD